MEASTGHEQCSIKCPNCGAVFIKSLEWLANHRNYVCNCGVEMDALQVHTEAEIDSLNKAIEKAKDK